MSASNNADWAPGTAFPADALAISQSGWYTFKHTFKNVEGQLTVDMSIIDAGGVVLKTWTLSPAEDTDRQRGHHRWEPLRLARHE